MSKTGGGRGTNQYAVKGTSVSRDEQNRLARRAEKLGDVDVDELSPQSENLSEFWYQASTGEEFRSQRVSTSKELLDGEYRITAVVPDLDQPSIETVTQEAFGLWDKDEIPEELIDYAEDLGLGHYDSGAYVRFVNCDDYDGKLLA